LTKFPKPNKFSFFPFSKPPVERKSHVPSNPPQVSLQSAHPTFNNKDPSSIREPRESRDEDRGLPPESAYLPRPPEVVPSILGHSLLKVFWFFWFSGGILMFTPTRRLPPLLFLPPPPPLIPSPSASRHRPPFSPFPPRPSPAAWTSQSPHPILLPLSFALQLPTENCFLTRFSSRPVFSWLSVNLLPPLLGCGDIVPPGLLQCPHFSARSDGQNQHAARPIRNPGASSPKDSTPPPLFCSPGTSL